MLLDGLSVWFFLRLIGSPPAPIVSVMSLRGQARQLVFPGKFWRRQRYTYREYRREHKWPEAILYIIAPALLGLPSLLDQVGLDVSKIYIGPFASVKTSEDFLGTLWQVDAAAVGLSVAMIAFTLEAFSKAADHQFGTSPRQFARRTGLLDVTRLGVLTLLMIGAVLLGLGYAAPSGWSAMLATLFSAITLLAVLVMMERALGTLGSRQMVDLRSSQLETVVEAAMLRQLQSQAADQLLHEERVPWTERLPISSAGVPVLSPCDGFLHDVRLGPVGRALGSEGVMTLLVGLSAQVREGDELARVPISLSARRQRKIRRSLRIRRRGPKEPDRELIDQIESLNGEAIEAIRSRRISAWREVAELYELILLALPKAAKKIGIEFGGAVAVPGVFRAGPLQKVAANFETEMSEAVREGDSGLIEIISSYPSRIASSAARVGAMAVSKAMLDTQVRLYGMSLQKRENS
jgi:hypothetical protein